MKLLAIDYGTKHIGLAISDEKPSVALPFQTITVTGSHVQQRDKIIADLVKLVDLEHIETIIVGMPLRSDGLATKLGDEIYSFCKALEAAVAIPVDVLDERFTSKIATHLPHKTSRNIHELSAQVLLQDYIDKLSIDV